MGGTFEGSPARARKNWRRGGRGSTIVGRWRSRRHEAKPKAKSKRALLWTSTTYFGEGLPWSFLHQMAAEFLTAIGASNAQVGMTSALHGAVTLKFLWSPIVDLFGRKRTWLWVMQIILGLGMLGVAAMSRRAAI